MDMAQQIEAAINAKDGNKEFALFYIPGGDPGSDEHEWEAHIGNPSGYVLLGEVCGELVGEGATPSDAIRDLLNKLGVEA